MKCYTLHFDYCKLCTIEQYIYTWELDIDLRDICVVVAERRRVGDGMGDM